MLESSLCVRCGVETPMIRVGGMTCMHWPVGVDYIDHPEPANHLLWICPFCWHRTGVELYWPSYGFKSDELQVLCARYDAVFQDLNRLTGSPWLN